MSRTSNNRRKKRNRRAYRFPKYDYWLPLVVNTKSPSWGYGGGQSMYTYLPACQTDEAEAYRDIPNARREDQLGQYHDHHDRKTGEYTDQGVWEDYSGTPDPENWPYGPKLCKTCKDTHENCQRVKCNVCGAIDRRFHWMVYHHMQFHVENPRSTVLFMPVE